MKFKTSILIFIFATIFLCSSDSFAKAKERSTQKPFKVLITGMAGDYSLKIKKRKSQHPYNIPEEAFVRMLDNFNYQIKNRAMNGFEEKKRRVFPEKISKIAAKYLREAFLKVKPKQMVVFTHETKAGQTMVEIFIQKEIINWKFQYMHGEPRNKGMWMLSLGYLQYHFGTGTKLLSLQGLLGGGNFKDTRWIQMPLLQLVEEVKGENKLIKGLSGKNEISDGKDKLEKLKKLTALYHRKLINKQEYSGKVEKLRKNTAGEKLDIEKELEFIKILKDEKVISRDAYMQKKDYLLEKY